MPVPFTCPHCGRQTIVPEQFVGQSGPCVGCGQMITVPAPGATTPFGPGAYPPGYRPPEPLGENAAIRMLIPVGRSGWAIAAGYSGLFSVLLFPAPMALILGIVAIQDIRKHPQRHGLGRAIFGLIMGLVGTAFLLLVIATAVWGSR